MSHAVVLPGSVSIKAIKIPSTTHASHLVGRFAVAERPLHLNLLSIQLEMICRVHGAFGVAGAVKLDIAKATQFACVIIAWQINVGNVTITRKEAMQITDTK